VTARSALATRAPFHLEATVRVLQRRPTNRVDVWERDRYLRVLPTAITPVVVEVWNHGSIDAPDVRFAVRSGGALTDDAYSGCRRVLRTVLGLDIDPAPLWRAALDERALRRVAGALRGMRPPRFLDLFETFVNVVPFQQVSLDAGVAMVGRVIERFGRVVELDGRRFHASPTAGAIAHARVEALRACGLSARKAETLRHVGRLIESGELDEGGIARMTTQEALRVLTDLPGIGPWSAALVLLRGCGRLDVFPPGDVGAERGLRALMKLTPRASLGRVIERFGDLRGYLYFYGLGGSLLTKGLIRAAPRDTGPRLARYSADATNARRLS
jgi:DNA-3-methyladenine glycosylase II